MLLEEPIWVSHGGVLAIHQRQLAEHGGLPGVRDEGLLLSALARPQQLFAYGDRPDLPALAAAYAYGIARNHPFVDGNKRTALVTAITFLKINSYTIAAAKTDAYLTFLSLAEGSLSEEALAQWLRDHLKRLESH